MEMTIIKSRFKQDGTFCYIIFFNGVPIQGFESEGEAQRKIQDLIENTPYREWLVKYAECVKAKKINTYNRIYERITE